MTTDLPNPVPFPLDKQMLPVPGTKQPGFSHIYKSAACPDWKTECTVYDALLRASKDNFKNDVAGWRPWNPTIKNFDPHFEWYTHEEIEEERTAIGSGLGQLAKQGLLGDIGQTEWTVGIWTLNRPEFMIIDYANLAYSRRTVSLYETYDAASAQYILQHAETRILFTTPNHVGVALAAAQAGNLPLLKAIVILDAFRPSKQSSRVLMLTHSVMSSPRSGARPPVFRSTTGSRSSILVARTSPPTSHPKWTRSTASATLPVLPVTPRVLSSLPEPVVTPPTPWLSRRATLTPSSPTCPLPTFYARLCEIVIVRTGGKVGYFCGDTTRILEDVAILKPEMFASVPRVLNRIAALIQAQASAPGLKGALLRKAIAAKIANHDRDGSVTHAVYDRLIFNKVKAVLGGNVKYITSGSAPIRGDVIKLLRVCLCCDVREGYGQTENYGFCTVMSENDTSMGSVGPVHPGQELKLRDVPDMGYTSDDKPFPRGEILVRSQCTFPGYYKDEAKTKEALTEDGFLLTGDIGAIDEFNRLKIVDRVKSLLKLSQGEYVAIDNLSEAFGENPLAAQLMVHGDSFNDYLVGIAVPEPTTFAPLASKILGRQIAAEDTAALQEACKDEKVIAAFLDQYTKIARRTTSRVTNTSRVFTLPWTPFRLRTVC